MNQLLWLTFFCLTGSSLSSSAFAAKQPHDHKILVSHFGEKFAKSLPDIKATRLSIREKTIHSLYTLPVSVKTDLSKDAENTFKHDHYPVKTAVDFMEFFRNGNRGHFQDKLHALRGRVHQLVIGNLLEREHNKTSLLYVEEIINGVWMVLEESTWCYPAHLSLQGTSDPLPDPTKLAIDLNAGEVAKFLAWVQLLMGEKFDQISTVVNKRIEFELRRRIFEGYLNIDFGWAGFGGVFGTYFGARYVNNWNIWINGNILKSALFTLNDLELFERVLNKTLYSGK